MHPHLKEHLANKERRLEKIGARGVKHEIENAVKKGVHEHERHLHRGEKETKVKAFANGGHVPGMKSKKRADRKGGGKTQVNVIVAGHGAQPNPAGGAMTPPMASPRPPVPPAGVMPSPMMGAPPPGTQIPPQMMGRKRGGKVYEAGAGTGEGRLEKIAAYGKKAAKR